MPKIYFYKLTSDNGGAPCVSDGLLSLAICKPMMRSTAEIQDVIFGFAADSLYADNRLIYVARVTDKVHKARYYTDSRYAQRADCIYRLDGNRFIWKSGSLYHGPGSVEHDLGKYPLYSRANVLLSSDFRYFGRDGTDRYKSEFPLVWRAIKGLTQGHRVRHVSALLDELRSMERLVWETWRDQELGEPANKPSRSDCQHSKCCGGVVERASKPAAKLTRC